MKKIQKLLFPGLILLIMGFNLPETIYADVAICYPDCPSSIFNGPFQSTFTINGCQVTVTWYKRIACNVWYDLQIVKVSVAGGCSINMTPAQLLTSVVLRMFITNPMGWPTPGVNECVSNWRVTKASCWAWDSGEPLGGDAINPCFEGVCCLTLYEVCNLGGGAWGINKLSSGSSGQCPDNIEGCEVVCD